MSSQEANFSFLTEQTKLSGKMHREEIHFLNNMFIKFFCFLTILSYRKSPSKILDNSKVNSEMLSRKIKKAVFTTPSQQTCVIHFVE